MNNTTVDRDQTDEDMLTHDVSDEALEAASGTEQDRRIRMYTTSAKQPYCVDC